MLGEIDPLQKIELLYRVATMFFFNISIDNKSVGQIQFKVKQSFS
jgi:hypothetical protein